MGWYITVDFGRDERETLIDHVNTPALGPAVESALHKLDLAGERIGSYQITVSNDSHDPPLWYSEKSRA